MTTTTHAPARPEAADFYNVKEGRVDFVDLPAFLVACVDGTGAPDSGNFGSAIKALYSVSYTVHFALKKAGRDVPKVSALEALWWADDPETFELMQKVSRGEADAAATDMGLWQWRALISQAEPIDEHDLQDAIDKVAAEHPELPPVHVERWAEGFSAQTLHRGPYEAEAPTIAFLHKEIAAHAYRPRGRHHEIYLGDPRRSKPENLKTLIRQPIERQPL